MPKPPARTPREVAERVAESVGDVLIEGNPNIFPDMFAANGVLEYPFAPSGVPNRVAGREQIKAHFAGALPSAGRVETKEVDAVVHETTDPEVVVTEIEHRGTILATNEAYSVRAIGVIRVRDGEIVHYRDYMNPLDIAMLIGQRDGDAGGEGR